MSVCLCAYVCACVCVCEYVHVLGRGKGVKLARYVLAYVCAEGPKTRSTCHPRLPSEMVRARVTGGSDGEAECECEASVSVSASVSASASGNANVKGECEIHCPHRSYSR